MHGVKRIGLCAAWLTLLVSTVTAVPVWGAQDWSQARDLSGVWWIRSYSPKILPGSTYIVLTPEAERLYASNRAGLRDGSIHDPARTQCAPDGVPRIMAAPFPFEISHDPNRVNLRFELNNTRRAIVLDQPFPASAAGLAPAALGHSYGRWDRDTLVVESTGFTDDTFLDATGLPHSRQLYVKEYFWKSDGGRRLQYVATVLDAETFSQVWAQRYVYERRSDLSIAPYECRGTNRDISSVPGSASWRR